MAYWLDELPSQSVLDGFDSFSPVGCTIFELSSVVFPAVLPTFAPFDSDYLEYEARVLRELGF